MDTQLHIEIGMVYLVLFVIGFFLIIKKSIPDPQESKARVPNANHGLNLP
jgi:hypothetical protein